MSLKRLDVGLAGKASVVLDGIRRDAGENALADVITRLKGLPTLLRTSGLPATMAFLYAKAGNEKDLERAYRAVRDALLAELAALWGWQDRPTALEFFERISDPGQIGTGDLARATVHLDEFASWLRRLAEALERAVPRRSGGTAENRQHEDESGGQNA